MLRIYMGLLPGGPNYSTSCPGVLARRLSCTQFLPHAVPVLGLHPLDGCHAHHLSRFLLVTSMAPQSDSL